MLGRPRRDAPTVSRSPRALLVGASLRGRPSGTGPCGLCAHHPVLFSLPVRLAQVSIFPKTQRPRGISTAPISASMISSLITAESGAPIRLPGTDAEFPMPTSLRQADRVYVAGDNADSGC